MPGSTPNTDILKALDQVIEAINDSGTSVDTDSIVGKLEEISTLLETRSIAEVTAQNTNFNDLIAAIEALTLSCQTIVETTQLFQTISCGGTGSRGSGSYPDPESPQTTTEEDREGDPPPGFEDWEEYDQYKCDTAYLILDQMIADIAANGLLGATYASIATLVPILIATFLTPIGWAEIIIIAGLFITIWIAGVNISLLSQLLIDNKEEFVCELLSATSVSGSVSAFAELVDSTVDGEATLGALPDVVRTQVKQYIVSFATSNSINRLYEKTPVPPPGGNDCSECEESCEPLYYEFATGLEGWGSVSANCLGNAQAGTGSVHQTGTVMVIVVDAGGGTRARIAERSSLSFAIQGTSVLKIRGIDAGSSTHFVRVTIVTNVGCRHLGDTTFPGSFTTREWGLTAYAGETLQAIQIYLNNSVGGAGAISVDWVEVTC